MRNPPTSKQIQKANPSSHAGEILNRSDEREAFCLSRYAREVIAKLCKGSHERQGKEKSKQRNDNFSFIRKLRDL